MMCLTSTITSSLMSLGVDRLCRTSNVSPSESGVLCTCANIYLNYVDGPAILEIIGKCTTGLSTATRKG